MTTLGDKLNNALGESLEPLKEAAFAAVEAAFREGYEAATHPVTQGDIDGAWSESEAKRGAR